MEMVKERMVETVADWWMALWVWHQGLGTPCPCFPRGQTLYFFCGGILDALWTALQE